MRNLLISLLCIGLLAGCREDRSETYVVSLIGSKGTVVKTWTTHYISYGSFDTSVWFRNDKGYLVYLPNNYAVEQVK